MKCALSHQKESELASHRDEVPLKGCNQWGSVSILVLYSGRNCSHSSLQDRREGARLGTRRKVRRLAAAVIQETDDDSPNYPDGIGNGESGGN